LDLLCTAVVVELVTNLIYYSEEIERMAVEEKKCPEKNVCKNTIYMKGSSEQGALKKTIDGRPHTFAKSQTHPRAPTHTHPPTFFSDFGF
jgi:hypothetical protein